MPDIALCTSKLLQTDLGNYSGIYTYIVYIYMLSHVMPSFWAGPQVWPLTCRREWASQQAALGGPLVADSYSQRVQVENNRRFRHPPNVPLLRSLWSLLDGIWGSSKSRLGVLVSGSKKPYSQWYLGPETSNIGYLDPLGL